MSTDKPKNLSMTQKRIYVLFFFIGAAALAVIVAFVMMFSIKQISKPLVVILASIGALAFVWGIVSSKDYKRAGFSTISLLAIVVGLGIIAASAYLLIGDISLFLIAATIFFDVLIVMLLAALILFFTKKSAFESKYIQFWGLIPFPFILIVLIGELPVYGVKGSDLNIVAILAIPGFLIKFIQNIQSALIHADTLDEIVDLAVLNLAWIVRNKYGLGAKNELPGEAEAKIAQQQKLWNTIDSVTRNVVIIMFGENLYPRLVTQIDAIKEVSMENLPPKARMILNFIFNRINKIKEGKSDEVELPAGFEVVDATASID